MARLVKSVWGLFAALVFVCAISSAIAADRQMTLLPNTDLPGFDYAVVKDTTAAACEAACTADRICRAFTYNGKAKWCFMKSAPGEGVAFTGATSGQVVLDPSDDSLAMTRANALPFPAQSMINDAANFAHSLAKSDPAPANTTYADLVKSGDDAVAAKNLAGAQTAFRRALGINGNDPNLWLKLATVSLTRAERSSTNAGSFASVATSSAINAYLLSESRDEQAHALSALAYALEINQSWPESIATYRASIALLDDADLQARLDKVVAEHGFRVVSHEVDAEAATPQICAVFSDPLGATDVSQYVVVDEAPQAAIDVTDNQICVTGVTYGVRYHIKLRAGLPSNTGETLRKDIELVDFVPDRTPFVGFANNAYVLPAGLGSGLPITSVNATTADIAIYRIGDRGIAEAVRTGLFQRNLEQYSAEDVANTSGAKVWDGKLDLAQGERNTMVTTAVPVGSVLTDMEPGAYVITAKVEGSNQEYWEELATQWFIVTDLGVTAVDGDDGVHAFIRSLRDATPVAGATVRLIAVNNDILGETTTDAEGRADFAPGLSRGTGGAAPQLVTVATAAGDYAFLDVAQTAFDLTDRGVEGRAASGALDLFATTERGIYRPGEIVYLTALLRDVHAEAVTDLPLTLEVERPDGVVAETKLLNDQGAGGYFEPITLVPDAMRGSWTIRLYADPKSDPLSSINFLVEDFEPERLAFDVTAPDAPVETGVATNVDIAAKYLYGATAPNLSVEADTVVRPTTTIDGYAGYTFGRADDTFQSDYEPLGQVGVTDENGNLAAEITIPEPQQTTRPLEAQIFLRLVDSNGRTIQRSLSRPVLATVDRIGIRPTFGADALDQGSQASFDIIAVAPTGETVDKPGLTWTLSRIETNYQWYRESGVWKWEAITSSRLVANGTVDATAMGPAHIAAQVDYGRYLLEVNSTGDDATSSSYDFYAGYYYPEPGSNTPDTLDVALDKPTYKVGETAQLKIDPQFAGKALVMVVDNRIISAQAVDVPEGGTTVPLTVTEDWGPGAYVTAILYRPSDAAEKRMPARALGLAFADVEPGDRLLDVNLTAPKVALPRQPFTVTVDLGAAAAGQDAYVAVAAVDLGILNLTNFQVPDPDGWFFGQRGLGVEFRDLYGQLIDPTQGIAGALRSGGDEAAARLGTPPPTSVLVAQHSGIVKVGADGKATITFDMPDFAGTVRLMAMAWTTHAVGHASTDVIVRDPVVVTLSPPRFLRLDDTARLLVEINNVSGPAGDFKVELIPSAGLTTDATTQTFTLATGERTSLNLMLTGAQIGDQDLRVIITEPDGTVLVKELTLGVRAASGPRTTGKVVTLAPGESVTFDASSFADLVPHSASLTFAVGPIARLDVPGLLLQLDRYPYGCAEQVTSRAFPLLYLNMVAEMLDMGSDDALDQRINDAIADLLSKQGSNGSFGLWGPFSGGDMWLDSYVTEFLLRAQAEGYEVSQQAIDRALDNLSNQVSYATDFTEGGEAIAYALYDLARAGRAAIGDLRYYEEARLNNFGSPLAQAQLGAALALYGDRTRASEAFAAALKGLERKDDPRRYRDDYGSQLRDTAAVLALAAETTPTGVDLTALAKRLADLRDLETYTSTQEDAWTLIAAAALARDTGGGKITVNDEELTGSVYRRYDQEYFTDNGKTVTITNNGNTPTEVKVTVTGIPLKPPPGAKHGFTLYRDYYLPDGTLVDDISKVTQNDRFVVVLTMRPDDLGSGQYLLSDPLPAGFEIDNPDLYASAGVGDLGWLTVTVPSHTEARTDQYVAAFRYSSEPETFSTAYMVRAVTPGSFVQPGATIEDMYRPELRANTGAGTIEIAPAGPPPTPSATTESPSAPDTGADEAKPPAEDTPADTTPGEDAAPAAESGPAADTTGALDPSDIQGLEQRSVQTIRIAPDGSTIE